MDALVSTAVVCLIVSAVHVTANLGGSSFLGYIKVYSSGESNNSTGTGFPKYMGCYLDDAKRMIAAIWVERNDMTRGWCLNHCRRSRHKYAALQHYANCLCGDSINIVRYPKKPESDCNQRCRGNTIASGMV
ncbi:WSC domain-containing protein 2-like isoform X2 [Haliotis rufescens]|uniref:WSC domain-containing protein 2-like isoform X2 n=1 Tax=Haliotis rufescens TaxID=6454 RepID=UPI001EAFFCA0|nr:WSC domain-containing protein 2-like isoform X2 [Haliotis rufescens]